MQVAMELEPTAMAEAANAIPARELGKAIHNLRTAAFSSDAASTELLDVPQRFNHLTRNLAAGAARALEQSVYTGIRIHVTENETQVERATPRGTLDPVVLKTAAAADVLQRTALDIHLHHNPGWGATPREIIERIEEARNEGNLGAVLKAGSLYHDTPPAGRAGTNKPRSMPEIGPGGGPDTPQGTTPPSAAGSTGGTTPADRKGPNQQR